MEVHQKSLYLKLRNNDFRQEGEGRLTGLYISITADGKIKKHISTLNGDVQLPDTTVSEELISFAEESFTRIVKPYRDLYALTKNIEQQEQGYTAFLNAVEEFLSMQDTVGPVYSTLTKTSIMDYVNNYNDPNNKVHTANEILIILMAPVNMQRITETVLEDLCNSSPIEDLIAYRLLKQTQVTAVFTFFDELHTEYIFRGYDKYYRFLLQNFVASKPNVKKCHYCGRYFIPKSKRNRKYCDRIIREGKTCKQIAPRLSHRERAAADRVISEFNRTNDMLLHRLDRCDGNKKPSPIDWTREQYYEWLEKATIARDRYLAREVSEEEVLAIIHVPTIQELRENNLIE